MTFQMIKSETRDGVLLLRLNDPATRNAVSGEMLREIDEELDRLERDPALRVLVLTGVDPAFCSGANVRGFQQAWTGRRTRYRHNLRPGSSSTRLTMARQ